MTFMTFDEWMVENVDLLDAIYDEKNCTEYCECGNITGPSAYKHAIRKMQNMYNERLKTDKLKLDEWNRLVACDAP